MKTFEYYKNLLSERRKNIKGFNKAFYKTFSHDMNVARIGVKESQELNVDFSISDFWNNSETHKTWFYIHNGGAYCDFLAIWDHEEV